MEQSNQMAQEEHLKRQLRQLREYGKQLKKDKDQLEIELKKQIAKHEDQYKTLSSENRHLNTQHEEIKKQLEKLRDQNLALQATNNQQ